MYIARIVVVFPFVIACSLLWAVIGLFFWIPTFTFAMADYQYSIFRHIMSGKRVRTAIDRVNESAMYYVRGFLIILGSLRTHSEDQEPPDTSYLDDFRAIARPAARRFFEAIAAWAMIAAALWFAGFLQPLLTQRWWL